MIFHTLLRQRLWLTCLIEGSLIPVMHWTVFITRWRAFWSETVQLSYRDAVCENAFSHAMVKFSSMWGTGERPLVS